ncbi:MAG: MarR family transcriptional regulator, partial [Betaproteobacteria bacterium]
LKAVEFSILTLVADNKEVNQKQLCQALDLSPPNLAVMLDRLCARGLIERVRGTVDRRAQIIHLTAAGRELQQRARKIAATMEHDATRVLSEGERLLLIELLHRVARGKLPRR